MFFASDNGGPVHPAIWAAMQDADQGYALSYGNDPLTAQVTEQMRQVFDAPDASVHLVINGTTANVLALATLAQPFDAIFCSDIAHIAHDECNAPEFFTGGAKLSLIPHRNGKITPTDLARAMDAAGGSVHVAQRGPLSITNVTEIGTVYTPDETRALCDVAKSHGVAVHLDGARFANAVAHLGCAPADLTWKAGVDAVSFGGTKNGLMGVEAVVFFNPDHAHEFELRRKRAGHLASKHRYLAAQMTGYLTDDLWLTMARAANDAAACLAAGIIETPGARLLYPVQGNVVFARWPRALHQHLYDAGAEYYLTADDLTGDPDEHITARLVCDWSSPDNAERFVQIMKQAC